MSNGVKNQLIPAILTQDINEVKDKLEIIAGQADWVQIDIMDGKFVGNVTIKVEQLKNFSHQLNLEAHLMVESPETYLKKCREAGIKRVIFHFEAAKDPATVIKSAKDLSLEVGLAINPDTPLEALKKYLDKVDLVLVMGVYPGRSGQKFIPKTLARVKSLRQASPRLNIEVDGGADLENIDKLKQAGVNLFVINSGIFQEPDPLEAIKKIKAKIL